MSEIFLTNGKGRFLFLIIITNHLTKSSSAVGRTRHWLGNTSTCPYYAFQHITKLSPAVGRTRHRLGNTSTCSYYAFRHITRSSPAAGRTRHRLGNTSTCSYYAFRHITKSSSAAVRTRRLARPAADHDSFITNHPIKLPTYWKLSDRGTCRTQSNNKSSFRNF